MNNEYAEVTHKVTLHKLTLHKLTMHKLTAGSAVQRLSKRQ